MKLTVILIAVVLSVPTLAQDKAPLTARDYFTELKAANNFNHYSDTFVCFRDDDSPSFAVVARGSDIIDEMKQAGHTPEKAVLSAKNELFVQTYYKGVANTLDPYDPVPGKEGTEWDGRIVYSINWKTGRYRMFEYALDYNKTTPSYESSGKCEPIHPSTKLE